MPKPADSVCKWAVDEYDQLNNPTKELVPTEFQQTGTRPNEPWVRVWMNYMFNNFSEYLSWLADEQVGSVRMVQLSDQHVTPQNKAEASKEWGGSWEEAPESPANFGGLTVRVFVKVED